MFDNLTVIALLIIGVWVLALAYYLYISNQQGTIEADLDELRQMLEKDKENGR